MLYTFDYQEILSRRVTIEALTFGDALQELNKRIDRGILELNNQDFLTGQISIPIEKNASTISLTRCGENMKDVEDIDIILEAW